MSYIYNNKKFIFNKEEGKKIRIRISCNWCDSENLLKYWKHILNCKEYNNIIFTSSYQNIDYYIIINSPYPGDTYIINKTIVFRMEPYIDSLPEYNNWLKDINRKEFIYFMSHDNYRNNCEWWISYSIDELKEKEIIKNKELENKVSVIVSSLYGWSQIKNRFY
jgi:hypothetical protein